MLHIGSRPARPSPSPILSFTRLTHPRNSPVRAPSTTACADLASPLPVRAFIVARTLPRLSLCALRFQCNSPHGCSTSCDRIPDLSSAHSCWLDVEAPLATAPLDPGPAIERQLVHKLPPVLSAM